MAMEVVKKVAKKQLRQMGIKRAHLNVLQYWVPYTCGDGKAFAPDAITVELTFRCNLSCQMCPLDIPRVMYNRANHEYVAERKKEEMTTAEVLTLVDDVADMGVKRITLTGGEAFLRTDIFEILARIKERGLRVCVNTNGWFLGKAQAKRIVEMGVDEMSISVDGPNETHDFIRRREGSFKHILDSLTNLAGGPRGAGSRESGRGHHVHHLRAQPVELQRGARLRSRTTRSSRRSSSSTCSTRSAGRRRRRKSSFRLPVAPKEEDQVLPFYLRDVDIDIFHAEVQKTLAKAKEYKLNAAFQPPITDKEGIGKRFFDVTHAYRRDVLLPVEGRPREPLRRRVLLLDRRRLRQYPSGAVQQALERRRVPDVPANPQGAGHLPQVHEVLCPQRPRLGPVTPDQA